MTPDECKTVVSDVLRQFFVVGDPTAKPAKPNGEGFDRIRQAINQQNVATEADIAAAVTALKAALPAAGGMTLDQIASGLKLTKVTP